MPRLMSGFFFLYLMGNAVVHMAGDIWGIVFAPTTYAPKQTAEDVERLRQQKDAELAAARATPAVASARVNVPIPLRKPIRRPVVASPKFRVGDCDNCLAPVPGGSGPHGETYWQMQTAQHPHAQ